MSSPSPRPALIVSPAAHVDEDQNRRDRLLASASRCDDRPWPVARLALCAAGAIAILPAAHRLPLTAAIVIFFFLSGWTRLRRLAITSRTSFGGAMATARVIQDVVDDTSAYLGTITAINVTLELLVAAGLWAIDMPTPLIVGRRLTINPILILVSLSFWAG